MDNSCRRFIEAGSRPIGVRVVFIHRGFFQFFGFRLLRKGPRALLTGRGGVILAHSYTVGLFNARRTLKGALVRRTFNSQHYAIDKVVRSVSGSVFPSGVRTFDLRGGIQCIG